MYFHYDWWFGDGLKAQIREAKKRCLRKKFPEADVDNLQPGSPEGKFYNELESRIIVYLRDGYTYELGELVDLGYKAYLTAECIPADEAYKSGVFVVSIPFEDIVRVEVFAVHPSEKPEEMMHITGFHAAPQS